MELPKGKDVWGLLFAAVSAIAGIIAIASMRKQQPSVTNVFPPLNTNDGTPSVASSVDTNTASQPNVTTSTQGVSTLPVQPIWTV